MSSAKPAKLLKARCFHSRIYFYLIIALILLCDSLVRPAGLLHEEAEAIGVVLVGIGIMGRAYCSLFIGGKKNDEIINDGPYGIVRNPLYVFSFLGFLGISMQSGMLTIVIANIIAFCVYYYFVVRKEEAYLTEKFGAAYIAYKAAVPRWFPNFKLWREPEMVEVRPKFIRLTMYDGLIFLAIFPVLELIEWLHTVNWLPNLILLP